MNTSQRSFFEFVNNTSIGAYRALEHDDSDYLEMYYQRIQVCESMLILMRNQMNITILG